MAASVPSDALHFPASHQSLLEPHLPPRSLPLEPDSDSDSLPFTTITFATSLDSQLALSPGTQTVLSGAESKAMTHFLRSRHDAILVGVGTAVADDPGLNCRIAGVGGYGGEGLQGQPRPIILDPDARWEFSSESKVFRLASGGQGKAPYVIISGRTKPSREKEELLEKYGGKFIVVPLTTSNSASEGGRDGPIMRMDWGDILRVLRVQGLRSVMVEGGAAVINTLLSPRYLELIDSVIVTIAPTWLGQGGVVVSPPRRLDTAGNPMAALRLEKVEWHPLGEDVVLCGKVKKS